MGLAFAEIWGVRNCRFGPNPSGYSGACEFREFGDPCFLGAYVRFADEPAARRLDISPKIPGIESRVTTKSYVQWVSAAERVPQFRVAAFFWPRYPICEEVPLSFHRLKRVGKGPHQIRAEMIRLLAARTLLQLPKLEAPFLPVWDRPRKENNSCLSELHFRSSASTTQCRLMQVLLRTGCSQRH